MVYKNIRQLQSLSHSCLRSLLGIGSMVTSQSFLLPTGFSEVTYGLLRQAINANRLTQPVHTNQLTRTGSHQPVCANQFRRSPSTPTSVFEEVVSRLLADPLVVLVTRRAYRLADVLRLLGAHTSQQTPPTK